MFNKFLFLIAILTALFISGCDNKPETSQDKSKIILFVVY